MPAAYAPTPQPEEHVAELRDGGVGEHFLDVGLQHADRGGIESSDAPDERDDEHGDRRARK